MFIVKKSFAGKNIVGIKGKPLDLKDKLLINDLLNVGYIEQVGLTSKKQKTKK